MLFNMKESELKKSKLYSEELGIDLSKKKPAELFKWFIASILFGARISETIAKNTYKTLEKYKLLKPQKILKAGWNFLVNPIMRQGGYVRYDGKTSDTLQTFLAFLVLIMLITLIYKSFKLIIVIIKKGVGKV